MSRMIAALVLCLVSTHLAAAPFRVGDIPKQAQWFVHVDVDAARAAPRIDAAITQMLASPKLTRAVKRLPLLKQVKWDDLMAYSVGDDRMVGVFGANVTPAQLVPLLQQETAYAQVNSGKHTIHHWIQDLSNQNSTLSKLRRRDGDQAKGDDEKDETEESESFYLCLYQPGRLVIANRLSDLLHQIRIWDGALKPIKASDVPHFMQVKGSPTLLQYGRIKPPAKEKSKTPEPACLYLAISGAKKMNLTTSWDVRSDATATMVMQFVKPEAILTLMKQLVPKDKTQTKRTTKTVVGKESGKPKNGRLSFSASLKDFDLEKDREQVLKFIARAMNVQRQGTILSLKWSSHAEFDFTYKDVDGIQDVTFQLHLLTDQQAATRQAKQSKAGKIRR